MRDRDIEGAIARLTRERSEQAPPFDRILAKPRRRSVPWWLAAAAIAAPVAVLILINQIGPARPSLSEASRAIAEWREAGRMVLASTHDLALMERRMDEICVLRQGRVLAHGSADDLRRSAALPHRIWFEVAAGADAKVELLCEAMRKWGKGRIERRDGRVLAEVDSDDTLELVEIQSGFPGVVTGIRVEEPTLDVVYDALLGAA